MEEELDMRSGTKITAREKILRDVKNGVLSTILNVNQASTILDAVSAHLIAQVEPSILESHVKKILMEEVGEKFSDALTILKCLELCAILLAKLDIMEMALSAGKTALLTSTPVEHSAPILQMLAQALLKTLLVVFSHQLLSSLPLLSVHLLTLLVLSRV